MHSPPRFRAKQFFVAAITDNGEVAIYLKPQRAFGQDRIRQFFDTNRFQETMRDVGKDQEAENRQKAEKDTAPNGSINNDTKRSLPKLDLPDTKNTTRRKSLPPPDDGNAPQPPSKRPKTCNTSDAGEIGESGEACKTGEEDESASWLMTPPPQNGGKIIDSPSLYSFYKKQFDSCQQVACKLIAKAWVKVIEPRKQSTYPYTGNEDTAPEWWPTQGKVKVRHKEPDHLSKHERIHLLIHILRLATMSYKSKTTKLSNLNLRKLGETTQQTMAAFFAQSTANASKQRYLQNIFAVAQQEERYNNGEIGK
ncbi:hypothetical protein RJ55_05118 [Drechmeria coniospora]|nr:hypothetical protein RJ55_05118 [Drechmeria coniospora]